MNNLNPSSVQQSQAVTDGNSWVWETFCTDIFPPLLTGGCVFLGVLLFGRGEALAGSLLLTAGAISFLPWQSSLWDIVAPNRRSASRERDNLHRMPGTMPAAGSTFGGTPFSPVQPHADTTWLSLTNLSKHLSSFASPLEVDVIVLSDEGSRIRATVETIGPRTMSARVNQPIAEQVPVKVDCDTGVLLGEVCFCLQEQNSYRIGVVFQHWTGGIQPNKRSHAQVSRQNTSADSQSLVMASSLIRGDMLHHAFKPAVSPSLANRSMIHMPEPSTYSAFVGQREK